MDKINWSIHASLRLDEIISYYEQNESNYISTFLNELDKKIKSLLQFPRKNRIVPELQSSNYREFLIRNYRIIYFINPNESIEIITILHSRQDFKLD